MKKFFRYDYNYKLFIIENLISLLFLAISLAAFHYDWDARGGWLAGVTSLFGFIYTFTYIKNQGIRIKNDKVIITDHIFGWFGQRFELSQVKYVELKEIKKEKRSNLYGFFHEFYHHHTYMLSCDYVYNHGRVFEIVFHLKDFPRREAYFGWMYREKNENTVTRVYASLEEFVKEINEYVAAQSKNKGK